MGSADIRAAVSSYFEGAAIPGLNKVYGAPPYWADGGDWTLGLSQGSAAVGAVHIVEESESRITVPIRTGQKMVEYKLGLMLFYQWTVPSGALAKVGADEWSDPLDVIIDGCKALLRADPNLGVPATVWQAGQDPNDIRILRDIPRRMTGSVLSWNVIEFMVREVVTA